MSTSYDRATFERRQALRAGYAALPRDEAFASALSKIADRILMKRSLVLPWGPGNRQEQILVSLSGKPGAGKSTLLHHGLNDHEYLRDALSETDGNIIEIETPESPSIRSLAASVIDAVASGLTIPRAANRSDLWRDAKTLLAKAGARVIVFNEFQNVLKPDRKETSEEILSNIRSLLIYPPNPVAIIAVGQLSMAQAIELDGSVERRTQHVPLPSLSASDIDEIKTIIYRYFSHINFMPDQSFVDWMLPRLMHSANYQFGILCSFLCSLCERAIDQRVNFLTQHDIILHYADEYKGRTVEQNPFSSPSWQEIDMSFLEDPYFKQKLRREAQEGFDKPQRGKSR